MSRVWYIAVFLIGHSFGFLYRIWEFYIQKIDSTQDHSYVLVMLQAIFDSVQGAGFAVMLGTCVVGVGLHNFDVVIDMLPCARW